MVAMAAQQPQDIQGVIGIFWNILAALIPVIFVLAFVLFLWGAAKYIYQADDATKRAEGNKLMLYGIIALFVMVSVWGLVGILGRSFGVSTVIPFLGTPTEPETQLQRIPLQEA